MKRTKTPALTSPWKIGFFVSLMLVFVSIGVTYFFARRFGVTWNILDHNWFDRNEWLGIIRGEGFISEMLPLVALVAVTSMIAYLVITGAVRKYKRYLDSGHDYRNLLSSLKDLEGLEDKRKIERIKNHPELKRVLLGLSETFEERERLLSEREGALETRLQDTLQAREVELAEGFAQECDRLVTAIESGSVEPSAIEFSNPGLRKLGEVIGRTVHPAPRAPEPGLFETHAEVRTTSELVQSKLHEIAAELRMSCENAQEIERRLREFVGSEQGDAGRSRLDSARKETKTLVASLKSLEQVNITIDGLSEEAKGIAINTALHAGSGVGTQEDLIRLAEEIKEVAARFKDATKQFAQTSTQMRGSAEILDAIAGDSIARPGRSVAPEEDLAGVLSRVSLWVERILVLSDKVSNFGQSYDIAVSSLPEAGRDEPVEKAEMGEPPAAETEDAEEFGFETLDRSRSLFGDTREPHEETHTKGEDREKGMFEELSSRSVPSFEAMETGEERGEEAAAEPGGTQPEPESDRFDSPILKRFSRPSAPASADEVTSAPAPDRTPLDEEQPDAERDEPFSVDTDTSDEVSKAEAPSTTPEDEDTLEPAEEIVDLYALGAVDYDPALHR